MHRDPGHHLGDVFAVWPTHLFRQLFNGFGVLQHDRITGVRHTDDVMLLVCVADSDRTERAAQWQYTS